ncbi:restriction endonuclease [Arthrobacter sulfonylureivorans]|uniref:Restriction endonuclease n=1 Tax=Arthrobacter sulfonylureivorans TaxID=2486855 RepID=A0ABY3WEU8_9MICC|nr:restriction endonuclease [Arthrobacter sulfonylureivorans]UNK47093.1 restriction endonuclease [Arthrobacter sulfonylureivorans]
MSQFENLSPYDFENLVRDLLARKFNAHLETFPVGRDGGIDVRYIGHGSKRNPDLIIQCKHYERSGFDKLKSKMIAERGVALKINAKQYVLATTVSMTSTKKTELKDALHPLIASESDIYAANDIASLLRDYPEVEKSHFRLWLNSTAVLERVLHNEIYTQTDVYLEELERTARTFVDNSGVEAVRQILESQHVCIISGPAGVGKTTLANMLLIYYVDRGFEPIVVSENFNEAQKLYMKDRKQIFLYDDFLGRTTGLEKLGKNEDSRLSHFIRSVSNTSSKRFLMTTRHYILEQAKEIHEPLDSPHVKHAEYFFKMASYTKANKAHILYNHLYFSVLSEDHKAAIVKSRRYTEMIDSENFTPRAVESAVGLALENEVEAENIAEFLVESLEDPRELWRVQLTKHMTHGQRTILAFLALERGQCDLEKLERFYVTGGKDLQRGQSFDAAMRGLEGSALEIRKWREVETVRFANPGVEDAVLEHLLVIREVVETLIGPSGYDRLLVLWNHANDHSTAKVTRPSPWLTAISMAPRSSTPNRRALQMILDSMLHKYIRQVIPGVLATWKKSVEESHLNNLLVMARSAESGHGELDFVPMVDALIMAWSEKRGSKEQASSLLSTLLLLDDPLNSAVRENLVQAAADFISFGPNAAPEDFYAMFSLVSSIEAGELDDFESVSSPLTMTSVREEAEAFAVSEWESIPSRSDLHELRDEVESWRDLLEDLGLEEPSEYMSALVAVDEAEEEANGSDEDWREESFSKRADDGDVHRLFASLTDD